ncbi:hypothetical protein CVT26_013544 [Gymnopilus dilepis]|uniref:Uncharacterized protein n=1 Tax=Gymnopilus dilepis TaxID=231916 RepID=A0A409YX02_9AGAR|nr:hypothetical protein CVT26_013544 [Gymnopilus dilepis]
MQPRPQVWGHGKDGPSEPEPDSVRVHPRRNETCPREGSPKTSGDTAKTDQVSLSPTVFESIQGETRHVHGRDPPKLFTTDTIQGNASTRGFLGRRSYLLARCRWLTPKLPSGSQASDPQASFMLRPHPLRSQQQPLPRFCHPAFASRKKLLTHPDVFTTENQNELILGKPL